MEPYLEIHQWFEQNKDDPYPGRLDIVYLVKRTGQSEKQIRSCLEGIRKKHKIAVKDSSEKHQVCLKMLMIPMRLSKQVRR